MAAATKPALSLKGTGIVFVGSRGADIKGPSRRGAGVYAWDTRHVSSYEVRPTAGSLRLRSAEILPDGALLRYSLGPLQISRRIRVENSIEDQWSIENAGPGDATFEADITVDADFRDLFEVRRRKRITKGHREPAAANGHRLLFRYTAVDGVKQSTELLAPVDAWQTGDGPARGRVAVRVAPGDRRSIEIDIRVHSSLPSPVIADRDWDAWQRTSTKFASDSPDLDAWIARSSLDLFMLSDQTPDGFFPSAGIPWFVAPFGRDSIMTALMTLPLRRDLAPAVLRKLSDNQGTRDVPERDEEPGRIPHEIRQGEIVRTGGAFGTPYYGTVDAPPLFVWLAAEAARWMPERDLIGDFEPNIRAALEWMEKRGDLDGDLFIEFERKRPTGITNQVWKDSGDSYLNAKGRRPEGPLAAVEVQAYAIEAMRSLAEVVAKRDPAWSAEVEALQPGELPERLGLAARHRVRGGGHGALRRQDRCGADDRRDDCGGEGLSGLAHPRALRRSATARGRRAHDVSRRMRPSRVVRRLTVPLHPNDARSLGRTRRQDRRARSSAPRGSGSVRGDRTTGRVRRYGRADRAPSRPRARRRDSCARPDGRRLNYSK